MAITSEFFFPSSDGKTLIHVNQWTPSERRILGVVQIAHGVAEYGARYAPFARFLCGHGFVVVANDHLGHGQSLIPGGPMVYLGEKDGWWNVVDDMECLRSRVAKVFPDRLHLIFWQATRIRFRPRSEFVPENWPWNPRPLLAAVTILPAGILTIPLQKRTISKLP